ncbi:hypothetical protein LshimejAT787_0212690 [Lyophyllum shimeji]|uniref:Uncharacterized protein n=1 Tax=Lyophyllum shimeji TaxID=47721 RepID=A0A9P3PHR5_LYOSH|nr:hypothetical protein LshimejAT787_0212690 [Lyophyllum shimeji]
MLFPPSEGRVPPADLTCAAYTEHPPRAGDFPTRPGSSHFFPPTPQPRSSLGILDPGGHSFARIVTAAFQYTVKLGSELFALTLARTYFPPLACTEMSCTPRFSSARPRFNNPDGQIITVRTAYLLRTSTTFVSPVRGSSGFDSPYRNCLELVDVFGLHILYDEKCCTVSSSPRGVVR